MGCPCPAAPLAQGTGTGERRQEFQEDVPRKQRGRAEKDKWAGKAASAEGVPLYHENADVKAVFY